MQEKPKSNQELELEKRYELDMTQEHFRTSNEPLINGIPMSKYFEPSNKVIDALQEYFKNENK